MAVKNVDIIGIVQNIWHIIKHYIFLATVVPFKWFITAHWSIHAAVFALIAWIVYSIGKFLWKNRHSIEAYIE